MWGDSEGAYSLTSSDELSKCLYQTTGPAHIPYNDNRWQNLLLHYDRLVHLHSSTLNMGDDVVGTACKQCAKYSATSSNLAALTLHISRMLRDLHSDLENYNNDDTSSGRGSKHRITIIGKARATCGALNLLRLLSHETIVQAYDMSKLEEQSSNYYPEQSPTASGIDANYILKESFTYRSRQSSSGRDKENDAAAQIISSLMLFLSTVGTNTHAQEIISIPEIYDVIVQILSLLLVLLSTQLYQPMISSAEALEASEISHGNFFLDKLMEYSSWQKKNQMQQNENGYINEPLGLLSACLNWLVDRPSPPRNSIASHYVNLTKAVAQQMTDLVVSNDGMYEDPFVVMAASPKYDSNEDINTSAISLQETTDDTAATIDNNNFTTISLGTDDSVALSSKGHVSGDPSSSNKRSIVLQPIRSILLLSSTVLLLPIRLVRLAFTVLGRKQQAILPNDVSNDDHSLFQQIQANCENSSWNKTNNILLLTDSPVADLGTAVILLVANNYRAQTFDGRNAYQNPFRDELALFSDARWSENTTTMLPDSSLLPLTPNVDDSEAMALSINFEKLFEAFGRICHTEVGALTLYTMLLSSPKFAESVAARSDLDLVVIPLLRSLYFSSVMQHTNYAQKKGFGALKFQPLSRGDKPYRSQSQLYVILILLLIFSRDPSFGRDSFRRASIPSVKWYKERQIKNISLGSMIIVVLLRVITFNLNVIQDEFLLSNCIAVLLNLSPHISQLHKYVASRITSVTISCFKRYLVLLAANGGISEEEGDLSSALGMHGEVCRTLLQIIKHSIRSKCVADNMDLVYSLLIEQRDILKICEHDSMKQGDVSSITNLIQRANQIIDQQGSGRSAVESMKTLQMYSAELKSKSSRGNRGRASSADSISSEATDATDLGNLTFTYEEEADPEVFFVPYLWDVVVGTLTLSTLEWSREKILAFPLNEDIESDLHINGGANDFTERTEFDHTPDVV